VTVSAALDSPLAFVVDDAHEAHEPPEARGLSRDGVRLMVSAGEAEPIDGTFAEFGQHLVAGDVLVVNASATIAAAFSARLPDGTDVALHYSGSLPGGLALVEVRSIVDQTTVPRVVDEPVAVSIDGGGVAHLLAPFADSRRLWVASLDLGVDLLAYAARHGRPIRYRHVRREWPLETYQTVFASEPGSAEMPSASRPFSHRMVTDLVNRGIVVVPVVLHAGVSSLEGGERPYPERYRVSPASAQIINDAVGRVRQVVAAGTTVVRALAAVTDEAGTVHAGAGWTEAVVTRDAPVRSLSGVLTGWHEPDSSHLLLLESMASDAVLTRAYERAIELGYLWHEFGDAHLILTDRSHR